MLPDQNLNGICVNSCWGNFGFDYVYGNSVGNSGGILCVWDPNSFRKNSFTISDYFVIIRGTWLKNGLNLLIVAVYGSHDPRDKRMTWDYVAHIINQWDGEAIIMGYFNEVRHKNDRFGSIFNSNGANDFNNFIANAGIEEVPLRGCKYTWCHKSASKMSKLDRFFISENLVNLLPNITAISLDRATVDMQYPRTLDADQKSDLEREVSIEKIKKAVWECGTDKSSGPDGFTFVFYRHFWTTIEKDVVEAVKYFFSKAKFPKGCNSSFIALISKIHDANMVKDFCPICLIGSIYKIIAKILSNRLVGVLGDIVSEVQLAFVKGDPLSPFSFILIMESLHLSFQRVVNAGLFSGLKLNQMVTLSHMFYADDAVFVVSIEKIKKAVWECGTDKSSGPDGFTFVFYRHFWTTIEKDVVEAVKYFFSKAKFPKGCNSSFIALISKIHDANMVKDFRPICLIGSIYMIIAKILSNRLVGVLGDIVSEVQSAFVEGRQILDGPFILNEVLKWCKKKKKKSIIFKVDFEKAYDSVRWDYLDEVLRNFGFGNKWCSWIQTCLISSRGSILLNGSPTEEFNFFKGLKQGDPLSPFLFILIMESLHLSFQRVVNAGLFSGLKLNQTVTLSHMFYADDAVFVDESIDSVFSRFNTIITSLKALDEGYSSKNYVRKFLRALHPKWRAKVPAIKESKDFTSPSFDELTGNLKVHKMIIKKDSDIVKAKGKRRSLALKDKKKSSNEECSTFESEHEKYAMAVRDFKKFFKRRGRCGDPNHHIGECPKPLKDKNQREFIGGSWSDSGEEDDEKAKDETCLVAQASNEVCSDSS
nr:RNA-directed DNA polymerase, eukaryota, reverse transcriptase zinc-binding domain protein [Tanacetum cinerariifolium]